MRLIVGAMTVLLTGLAVFYWTSASVTNTSPHTLEKSETKASSSEPGHLLTAPTILPPDPQVAVNIVRQNQKGREKENTRLWFHYSFNLAGEDYYVVFTQTPQVDDRSGEIADCHACGVMVSVVTYKLTQGHWDPLTTQLDFTESGAWGKAPEMPSPEVLRISGESVAILIPADSGQGGYLEKGQRLLAYSSSKWGDIGHIGIGASYAGDCTDETNRASCFDYEGKLSVDQGEVGPFPDLVVTYSDTDDKGNLRPPDRYRFDGKEYGLLESQ